MLRLRMRVKYIAVILVAGLLLSICSSCTIRAKTVFIPPKTPVILRQDVKNVDLWVLDEKTGMLLESKGNLYRGQHVISFDISELGTEVKK